MVFHSSLIDSKSPKVSSILLNIPADLNDAIVWIMYGGARGVMVIVVGNGLDDTSSNPGGD